jgi:hypothetical protein
MNAEQTIAEIEWLERMGTPEAAMAMIMMAPAIIDR